MVIKPHHFMDIIKLYEAESRFLYQIRITAMIFTGQQMRL